MRETSIQVRRISERVKRFFDIFGIRHHTTYYNNRVSIKGSKRLGQEEFEAVISDTARGTSVGFYKINSMQSLIYTIPFLSLILIHLLLELEPTRKFLKSNNFNVDIIKLLTGKAELSFNFILIILIISSMPFIYEYFSQQIRLNNIKARFSFFSRDAIWETRGIPSALIILQVIKSAISHGIILAILYFLPFATTDNTLAEINTRYQSNSDTLYESIANSYTITVGLIIGIISADKGLKIRREIARVDSRSRFSGSLLERRIETVLFAVQLSLYSSFILALFLSQTFFIGSGYYLGLKLILFAVIGGIIMGFIHLEDEIWITSAYAVTVFFTTIFFIFQTGSSSEYAFVVVLQLFLVPIPFIIHFSKSFNKSLLNNKISSSDWHYDLLPIAAFYSIYIQKRNRKTRKLQYEKDLESEIDLETEAKSLQLSKTMFKDKNSTAFKLARHYFELLMSYTASYEEDALVIIPTSTQLNNWWIDKVDSVEKKDKVELLDFIDKLMWDTSFLPNEQDLTNNEKLGKSMVIAIQ